MLESTRELSAPVTARSRGAATGISGAGNTGAGNEGGGRAATRSSRNCFNTSLVTMATIEAVEAASVGGRSSGRPAAAEAIRRRRTGGAGKSGSVGRVRAARRADGGRTAGAPRFAGRPAGMLQN
ncbi:hypothetical protein NP493_654g01038 [Ridgeia piscesae]|uniref:Uncharacterized protein n=1 Tax=Ridgeia piscesae TaxID=27915 RepID=A0AAD9NQ64_RIDPI|nr:hypothetical protein NP493_654g01038 [Ridgeia piscesae]